MANKGSASAKKKNERYKAEGRMVINKRRKQLKHKRLNPLDTTKLPTV
jgi:translation elongation factor EF-Ts